MMRAVTVVPGERDSLELSSVDEPEARDGELLVEGLAVGVCGTDKEIAAGDYGWAPSGRDRLIIGHESLGRVREAPQGCGFGIGDLIAGIVRRPDPVPCGACAHDEFDMCRNGAYLERGIKQLDGYASEVWSIPPAYALRLDPALGGAGVLMEPTSVVAKAWEQVERVGQRAWFDPSTALVTGAGPIGLLAAMLGVQRGLDVHVLDRVVGGPKPALVRDLGATYHHDDIDAVLRRITPDIVIEATGAAPLVVASMAGTSAYGIVCLTGVSTGGRALPVDAGELNRSIVLENDAVIGSVNANRRHYALAGDALAAADLEWLNRLVSRRVPIERFDEAYEARDDDVKVVIGIGE